MKRILFILTMFITLSSTMFLTSCTTSTNDSNLIQTQRTEQAISEAIRQVGFPEIVQYTELKQLKEIYELRDRADLLLWAYYLDLNGNKHYIGRSIGYGIPYTAQFSNPVRAIQQDHAVGIDLDGLQPIITLPQPEPNGVFMPDGGLSATWLTVQNPNDPDDIGVFYVEPEIIVSPWKLH